MKKRNWRTGEMPPAEGPLVEKVAAVIGNHIPDGYDLDGAAKAAIAIVLEEAAKVASLHNMETRPSGDFFSSDSLDIAAAIRALGR